MRLLLDTCVALGAVEALRRSGHDVAWSGELDRDPGDEALLDMAIREGRVLITLDKDFGELAVVRALRHCGIVRLVGFRALEQGEACRKTLERYGQELAGGALLTVEPSRVRVRPGDGH